MIKTINQLVATAKQMKKVKIVVAAAQEHNVINSVHDAYVAGVADSILVGDQEEIINICNELNINPKNFEIVDADGDDLYAQADVSMTIIKEGRGQVLMKGLIDTSILLKTLLKKEYDFRTGKLMNVTGIFESPHYHKLFMITDPGMNLRPDLIQKKQIIENAVELAHAMGIAEPKVAMMCAKEKVNEKMQETLDAAELRQMNMRGEIDGCIVSGPLAFDNIVSSEAARIKGIVDPVAGDADIIVVPDLVSGNSLYKSLEYLSEVKCAGIVQGAKIPVIVTSRADSREMKLNSIALSVIVANHNRKEKNDEA